MVRKLRIRRKGFWRGPYVYRRRGRLVKVKKHYVGPTSFTQRDIGAPGRGKKIILIREPGELTKHGYSVHKSAKARHAALAKAVREDGASKIWHRLHAQVIYRKRVQPKIRKIFEADRDWVAKKYGGPKPTKALKVWKSMSHRERQRRMPGGKI